MKKLLLLCALLAAALLPAFSSAEPAIAFQPENPRMGDYVDVTVVPDREGAQSVSWSLSTPDGPVFTGDETDHYTASFRPRTEAEYTLSPSMTRGDTVGIPPSSVSFSDDDQPGTRTCTAVFPLVGNETVTVVISGIPTGESESDSYQLSSVFTFSGLESNYTYTSTNNVITKK